MSLEASIQELNTNILALIGVMSNGQVAAPTPAKSGTKKAAPAAALVAAASPTTTAAPAPQPVSAPTAEQAKKVMVAADVVGQLAHEAAGKLAPTSEQVRSAAIKLGQVKGRDVLVSLLTDFGVSKTPELPPHMYASFIAKATAKIEASAA